MAVMNRHGSANQRAIEKLIALLAGGFRDQFTAMAGRPMGWPNVIGMIGVVLRAEGIVAAELCPLEGPLEV